ncbi:hypothetical protein Hamer_G027528 [Homarus americanus]|uniref:Uncharacterized protein n=1 Tax=Homarus americanus TaxID=6706 RepID=A0A8J5K5Z3_HOMAM|nr:hypothetical protein Hamer_G027528 [Homarus americanus]
MDTSQDWALPNEALSHAMTSCKIGHSTSGILLKMLRRDSGS